MDNKITATIAYRDCSRGTGAFWDHHRIQSITGGRTIAATPEPSANTSPIEIQASYTTDNVNHKGHYCENRLPKGMPKQSRQGWGLLIVPGGNWSLRGELPEPATAHMPKKNDSEAQRRYDAREAFEHELLRDAIRRGRPILAICHGSARLLEVFGGVTRCVKPKTHQSRQMLYLCKDGSVANVCDQHDIKFIKSKHSLLKRMVLWERTPATPPVRGGWKKNKNHISLPDKVNSMHWSVAAEKNGVSVESSFSPVPEFELRRYKIHSEKDARAEGTQVSRLANLVVTVRAQKHSNCYVQESPKTKASTLSKEYPEYPAEAFETRYGAPTMGVQWHPEAYEIPEKGKSTANRTTKDTMGFHHKLILYFAQAGWAYGMRVQAVNEIKKAALSKAYVKSRNAADLLQKATFQMTKKVTAVEPEDYLSEAISNLAISESDEVLDLTSQMASLTVRRLA
ncbi:hypothetical protein MPB2EB_0914 [Mycoavidus sp. B2-EB]|nr:hypothetical protein MPB2EB_0914 [Mycoavidus sp. B2-EB]